MILPKQLNSEIQQMYSTAQKKMRKMVKAIYLGNKYIFALEKKHIVTL